MNLDQVLFDNTLRQWLAAATVLAISVGAIWLLQKVVLRGFARFARSTETQIDDLVSHVLGRLKFWLALLVSVYLASHPLTLAAEVELLLRRIAVVAVILQGGVWGSAAITFWVERYTERMAEADAAAVTTVSALSFAARLCVWVLVLLLILDNFGIEVTALLTGLGIGGIAVALAVQSILGDLFASLSIVLDKPFVMGDFLILDDYMGTVEHVGLKTTRLRSLSGEQLVLGNNDLLKARIRNLGRMAERRAVFTVGATYQTPREKLAAIPGWIREIIEAREHTRFDRSHLKAFGDYSIDFESVYFMTVPEYNLYMDAQQAINLAIHERFEREGVEFAYPTQVIYSVEASGS